MGHTLLATLFVSLFSEVFPLLVAGLMVTIFAIVWEYLQLKYRGATVRDYLEDIFFWLCGVTYGHFLVSHYDLPSWLFLPFIVAFYIPYRLGGGRLW